MVKGILARRPSFNFSSPIGVEKHDCMQFADSESKFACGAQFFFVHAINCSYFITLS
jgi:hypothetical protein